MPKVTYPSTGIIILTYNSENYIIPCIKSVLTAASRNVIVIIVDNNSTDTTVHLIQQYFPRLHIIQNKKNLGYAGGNNVGIRYFMKQKKDYVLLLNPDTTVEKTLIESLITVFGADKKIGVAGPMIMYLNDKEKIWYAGGYFNKYLCYTRHPFMNKTIGKWRIAKAGAKRRSRLETTSGSEEFRANTNNKLQNIKSGKTSFVTGACMMVRMDVFKKVGLLPEEYFLYYEDVFFCQFVKRAAYYCYFLAQPLVYHQVSASTGVSGKNDFTDFKAYYFARNPTLYIRRELHGVQKVTSFIGQCLIQHPYFLWEMLKKRQFHAAIGYIRGIREGLIL
jgi:GT2 family glycosyltransferase